MSALALSEFTFQDLAAARLAEITDELDDPRALVTGKPTLEPAEQFRLVELLTVAQHHDRFHGLTPVRVGYADDGGLEHRRVRADRVLDLDRVDVLSAHDDHVLEPVVDVEESVVVDHPDIAGAEPAVGGYRGRGLRGFVPISCGQLRRPQPDLAVLTGADVATGGNIDDPALAAGVDAAHATRMPVDLPRRKTGATATPAQVSVKP